MSGPAALLTAVVFLPALGALALTLLPSGARTTLKATAIGIALGDFALSLLLWLSFDPERPGYQFSAAVPWIEPLGITYRIGIDGLSLVLVVLTTFILPIALIGAWRSVDRRVKAFCISMLLLQTGMLGAFIALDLFLFYVFWEAMLIPMYFLIGIWGGAKRIYAALKFFIFTMAGSLLMLVAIIYIANLPAGGWDFGLPAALRRDYTAGEQFYLFWAFAIAFAIKVPMFPVHTWLPDAHVEAPTAGSVILAGVLLKLGVYGFLRFAFPLFPAAAVEALPVIGWLGVVGIIYGAMVAWVQPDMKKLVAYSSVSHLGFCMLGLAALTHEGLSGAVFIMIAHGVSTPALFLLVGVLYEQRQTRKLADYGGIAQRMPVFAFLLVTAALASAGLPALSGFPGEFLVLLGVFTAGPDQQLWAVLGATGVILAAVYLLWMVQKVLFGPLQNPANESLVDINPREFSLIATLMTLALVLGLYPNVVLDPTAPALSTLVNHMHKEGFKTPYRPDRGAYRSAGLRLIDVPRLRPAHRPRLLGSPQSEGLGSAAHGGATDPEVALPGHVAPVQTTAEHLAPAQDTPEHGAPAPEAPPEEGPDPIAPEPAALEPINADTDSDVSEADRRAEPEPPPDPEAVSLPERGRTDDGGPDSADESADRGPE